MIGQDTIRRLLADEDRGVSEVIGAILVFGLVVALMAVLQTQAIPSANEEVEFKHSQEVRGDMAALQVAFEETATSGHERKTNVDLGTNYPPRMLFYNPAPANGRLTTTPPDDIVLQNVESSTDAGKFYQATGDLEYSTRALAYGVNYNELKSNPSFVKEPAVFYRNESGTAVVEDETFIDGNRIRLVTLGGDLSEEGVTGKTLRTKPLSAPATEYQISDDGSGPITITVPTRLPAEKWNETLADEYAQPANPIDPAITSIPGNPDGRVVAASYTTTGGPYNLLTVEFEAGQTYSLSMAKVGVGRSTEPPASYVVPVTGNPDQATIEVRDRFNNPVSDVTLDAIATTGSGDISNGTHTGTSVEVTTGTDGRASVTRPSSSNVIEVRFEGDLNNSGSTNTPLENTQAYFAGNQAPILLERSIGPPSGASSPYSEIRLAVNNEGRAREISRVQTHYITKVESEEVLTGVTLGGGPPGGATLIEFSDYNSNVTDGPNGIAAVSNGTYTANLNSLAVEGDEPVGYSPSSGPIEIGTGSSRELNFVVDPGYDLEQREFLLVSVTVFYEDGHRERYTTHIEG